ncbi:helix-turn-helix domain-containing protein [Azohydromonas lata]|uniref:Helix-turn-helix domain-containing protein n=1 Tax=Azohydromonas lata TaxID=45677 RepID=A0ABU5ISD2_9BURK|nr:helix-turn-helix domain-containing protein [Azohydromonas lata]MDZ5461775.1 helix-turn-helix domain-containing protein [Azohydromonas lata]
MAALLAEHRGSRAELARRLGISERSLYRKLRALEEPAPTALPPSPPAD